MPDNSTDTRTEIILAARGEFIARGYEGARTQAIADRIGVTKAMIHYYFDTKHKLFQEVFKAASKTLMNDLMDVLEESTPLFQKIEAFIDAALDRFSQNPELTGFVITELNNHGDITEPLFRDVCKYDTATFDSQVEEAASNYEIAPVQPEQVVANMLSLCMFPYAGRAFLQTVMRTDQDYEQFLSKRREVVKDTVINWMAG